MSKLGRMRINGHGEVEVEFVAKFLSDLTEIYNSIFLFDFALDIFQDDEVIGYYVSEAAVSYSGVPINMFRRRQGRNLVRDWMINPSDIQSLVPQSDKLILKAVRLESPGFWEFLGKLNPLEVIRQYLNDRHERRKDRGYREYAEERRLRLENFQLENKVIQGRIEIARSLGATERDLAPLLNKLIYQPLSKLDLHQDQGVIDGAEIHDYNRGIIE